MNHPLSDHDAEAVNQILVEELAVDRDQLKPEAHLYRDLGADSLSIIEIGMRLEDRFHLTLADENLEQFETVADVHESLALALSRPGHSACSPREGAGLSGSK